MGANLDCTPWVCIKSQLQDVQVTDVNRLMLLRHTATVSDTDSSSLRTLCTIAAQLVS